MPENTKNQTETEDSPTTLTWWQHVRKRPGMYLGRVNNRGFVDNLKGLLSNGLSTQEAIVALTITGDRSVELEIIAPGMTFYPEWEPGRFGDFCMELLVFAALSSKCTLELRPAEGRSFNHRFQVGVPAFIEANDPPIVCTSMQLTFTLDPIIWGEDFALDPDYLIGELRTFAYLHPETRFDVRYRVRGEDCRVMLHYVNGLRDYLRHLGVGTFAPTILAVACREEVADFYLDFAFGFNGNSVDPALFKSYVNDVHTHEHGTHEEALLDGVADAFSRYLKNAEATEAHDLSHENILKTLIGALSVRHPAAVYEGATRTKLGNEDVIAPISQLVSDRLFAVLAASEEETRRFIRYNLRVREC